jgi:Asp-tRNA(Asn)/Glu-tRNA(Gln) amidotransferase A subunit family amidase
LNAKEEMRQRILKIIADNRLDALAYATFDHQTTLIADDVLTNRTPRMPIGRGQNRYLVPLLGWPALSVPACFTSDQLSVGWSSWAARSANPRFSVGYTFQQGTHGRRPPASTSALAGEP